MSEEPMPESPRDEAEPVVEWTCPHGTTYTGAPDFIAGARNAHDEIANSIFTARDRAERAARDFADALREMISTWRLGEFEDYHEDARKVADDALAAHPEYDPSPSKDQSSTAR